MKRVLFIAVIMILVFSMSTVYGADEITVLVNGTQVKAETPAVIVSGTTMLPFRAILNALGVRDDAIKWNEKSQSIEIRRGNQYIFLVIGNCGALVNDKFITLSVPPYIENGRALVPVRFVSEVLGSDVKWVKNTKTVIITNNL